MADFAVSAIISASDKLTAVFTRMGTSVKKFGSVAQAGFMAAVPGAKLLSNTFHSMAGQFALGGILSAGIQRIGRELHEIPEELKDFATRGEEIGRTSRMLGLSADSLQRLQYVAKMTHTPTEVLENAFKKLNMAIGQGERGKGALIHQLMILNPHLALSLRNTRDTRTAMMLASDAIAKETDIQKRAAIAVAMFGRAGQEMIPILSMGSTAIEKLMGDADKYGYVFDAKALAAANRFTEAQKKLSGILMRLKDEVLAKLMEKVTPLIEKFIDWYAANRDIIDQKIDQVFNGIVDAIQKIVNAWNAMQTLAGGHLVRDIIAIAIAWKAVAAAIAIAKAVQVAFNLVAPGGGAASGVAAVAGGDLANVGAGAAKWFGGAGAASMGTAGVLGIAGGAALGMMALTTAAYGAARANPSAAWSTMQTADPWQFLHAQGQPHITNNVNVDNSAAPGVKSTVRQSQAISGGGGAQYAGGPILSRL